jgi:hypothetical protein
VLNALPFPRLAIFDLRFLQSVEELFCDFHSLVAQHLKRLPQRCSVLVWRFIPGVELLPKLGYEGLKVGRHKLKLMVSSKLSNWRSIQLNSVGQEFATKINELNDSTHERNDR